MGSHGPCSRAASAACAGAFRGLLLLRLAPHCVGGQAIKRKKRIIFRHNETGTPRGGKKPARDRGAPDGRDPRLDGRVRRRRGGRGCCSQGNFSVGAAQRAVVRRRRANLHHHLTVPPMSSTMVKKRWREARNRQMAVGGRGGRGRGEVSDRWITRCTKEAITGDLATGCGCPSEWLYESHVRRLSADRTGRGRQA